MSTIEKLKNRFLSVPNNFTWKELEKILKYFGYKEIRHGKTGGSRVKFYNQDHGIISLHKPHPQPTLKVYMIKQIIEVLKERGQV